MANAVRCICVANFLVTVEQGTLAGQHQMKIDYRNVRQRSHIPDKERNFACNYPKNARSLK